MRALNLYSFILFCAFALHIFSQDTAQEFYALAKQCKAEKKLEKALIYYKQVLRIKPNHLEAALDAAQILYEENKTEEAITFYKQALTINGTHPEIYYNLGLCLLRLNKLDEAYTAFNEARTQNPAYIKAYIQQGSIHNNKKEFTQTIDLYNNAIKNNPTSSELYYHLGRALREKEQYEEAIFALEKAIELNPKQISILLDLANTLHMVDQFERACTLYKKVLDIKPDCSEALYNLGCTIKKCDGTGNMRELFEQAIQIHNKALEIRPNYTLAHFSRSLSYLTLGNFELGWSEYEHRWSAYDEKPKSFSQPVWQGQNLNGKRILIYAEQGYGDTFQFIRYGKVLKDMGAYVIMQTQHRLKSIIAQCSYLDEVISDREPLPAFDYHIALMSIPMVVKTRVETVPHEIPYLNAKKELIEQWNHKFANDKNLKIGICWQGNKGYHNVFLKKEVANKAMRLKTFKPLASLPNVSLYSLQKINGTEQLESLTGSMKIIAFDNFDEAEGPFMDTAAIIRNLDLVITVDTSIAHLAAGLGKKVWILLPFHADWRWMLDRTDTPWYPNVILFRQSKRNDWDSIIKNVVEKLKTGEHTSSTTPITLQTQLLPTHNTNHISSIIATHSKKHLTYMEQSAELTNLTQQLLVLNQHLWKLDKALPDGRPNIFDPDFINLAQEIYKINALKGMLVQQINEITCTLKNSSNI